MKKKKKKRKITKAVIAVAGYGMRFLPATKNQPKQMLPIIDKPIIHHVVEECVASGIKDVIMVTQAGQGSMEDYFDSHVEIEHALEVNGKKELLDKIRQIPNMANFVYVRQKKNLPYGNGTPLLTAAPLIDDDEAFVYLFGDDLTIANTPVSKQLINKFNKYSPFVVLGVQEVPNSEVERYGVVEYKKGSKNEHSVNRICEKMPLGKNPSNMAVFGRYVCNYQIIREAKKTKTGKDNELWMTDILNNMAKKGYKIIAQPIQGEWLTTGDPLRYMKAQVRFALEREDMGEEFAEYLRSLKLEKSG